jgi:DNA-dependent RNA polymerase auxiliary subunit epsilon
MSQLYTFSMPFRGTQAVWLEADSEEEARRLVQEGSWEDSEEQTFESVTDYAVLVHTEDLDDEEKVVE